eukprot:CAMPEP_0206548936 /NCGR_PEP_ID=MMETSP0325_2-20121206/14170_1 /ASSEMBLY_ACC=CAM_ASM_000347 /TAXON_ID=2866 /ORGANISM="Crypthecodinium cohnii, Strain Seligo" /LENGTH=846 /DNA_ID=CAMNT_0054048491 /DNA_START=93 /DNA_END=2633 /DNA_ORIENTATION=-
MATVPQVLEEHGNADFASCVRGDAASSQQQLDEPDGLINGGNPSQEDQGGGSRAARIDSKADRPRSPPKLSDPGRSKNTNNNNNKNNKDNKAFLPAGPPPPSDASTSMTGDQLKQLRTTLGLWLTKLATFETINIVVDFRLWLDNTPLAEVEERLRDLILKDSDSAWALCGVEDDWCTCSSGQIRYGHPEKTWLNKNITPNERFQCKLSAFGKDVAVGTLKQCQCFTEMVKDPVQAAMKVVKETARSDSPSPGLWSSFSSSFGLASHAKKLAGGPSSTETPATSLRLAADLSDWIATTATGRELALLSWLRMWIDTSGQRGRISVKMSTHVGSMVAAKLAKCEDGSSPDLSLCPGYGQRACPAGCAGKRPLAAAQEAYERALAKVKRKDLCPPKQVTELLWSCDKAKSRMPKEGHPDEEAQGILDKSVETICEVDKLSNQMDIFLECGFIEQYLRWTTDDSEWIPEAYVSYVGGKRHSTYEWQATNLLRAVDAVSTRPIILVIFGDEFITPPSWLTMPNVIVMRMFPIIKGMSFNFNKMRSMIASRVRVGVQLDTDQLIAPGFDNMFAGTRREIHEFYPWIMMPVHWMSREGKKPEPYWEYAFRSWNGVRSMRWGHAHPTWSYWALPWLCDMTSERYRSTVRPGTELKVFDFSEARTKGLKHILDQGRSADRKAKTTAFMNEDEDMMNVALWRDTATKDWCKYDLEWGLFTDGRVLASTMYHDLKWYPDGLPIIFTSMHNTKAFESADALMSLLTGVIWSGRRRNAKPAAAIQDTALSVHEKKLHCEMTLQPSREDVLLLGAQIRHSNLVGREVVQVWGRGTSEIVTHEERQDLHLPLKLLSRRAT